MNIYDVHDAIRTLSYDAEVQLSDDALDDLVHVVANALGIKYE